MEKFIENLYESVSESCFEDIVSMVEELIQETSGQLRNNLIAGRKHDAMTTGREQDIARAARTTAEAKKGKKFVGELTPEQHKLVSAEKKATLNHEAAVDKLRRAQSLVNRLNNRVKVSKDSYVDKQ